MVIACAHMLIVLRGYLVFLRWRFRLPEMRVRNVGE
jgi:hypothetical protein